MTWEEILKQTGAVPGSSAVRRHPQHHEDNLQIQCVSWMQLQHPLLAPYLVHCPNGGARSAREGAIFKKMGVRAGFPDLFLYIPNEEFFGLAIEMKTTERGSRQRENQREWERRLKKVGYDYHIARTLQQFKQIINTYLTNDKRRH